ncbi:MAG: FAD:protein FMN transferase [Planctomyces sp.]|nr:FAD:protein FMN transferase [Planctomyces sp.]
MSGEPPQRPASTRREFLSGRAAQRAVERAGEALADRLTEGSAGTQAGATVRLETRAMGCPWNVILNPGPPRQVMQASDALDVVHQVERRLTVYRDDSDVARLNATAAEGPQAADRELFEFLVWTRELCERADGAFDSAAGALVALWRRARQELTVPTQGQIAAALDVCGVRRIGFDAAAGTISFPAPGFAFDLGAVGKGYGVDRAAEALAASGLEDFVLHGGYSSIAARGDHLGQGGWPVALTNPLFLDEPYVTLLLRDEALGTSGSNVQFYRHEGRRYGHVLDPRTGWPAEGLLSVSVVARSAAEADAFSTALYVMGLEKATAWCQDHLEIGAILVPPADAAGNLHPVICNLPEERLFFADARSDGAD